MSRRHLIFDCEGEQLAGTLDEGSKSVGLLIVSGGNEIRSGAFAGQARLAAQIALQGYPVFRFDRRGVGDSGGENGGFRASGPDIAAALAAFRKQVPDMQCVVGMGNCDAASALMLFGGARFDALVLANPWTFDEEEAEEMPAAAIRARYVAKLRNPAELLRLLTGKVSLGKLAKGVVKAAQGKPASTGLAAEMREAMKDCTAQQRYLVAANDRTGMAFKACWPDAPAIHICENASHAFVEPHAQKWLSGQILAVLEKQAGQLDMG